MVNIAKEVEILFEDITAKLRTRLDELTNTKWKTTVRMVDIDMIYPNPFHAPQKFDENELKNIAQHLKTEGIRTPLTIKAIGTAQNPMFQLIAGEKQYQACLYARISPIPCVILDKDSSRMEETGDVSFSHNYFEEAELFQNTLDSSDISEENFAKKLGITVEILRDRLTLLKFDSTERKLILKANLSVESAVALEALPPRVKREIYQAMEKGVSGKSLETAIAELSASPPKARSCIKDTRFFFNTVDKAVKTMNESGIPIKCTREERKNSTKLVIIVPKQI